MERGQHRAETGGQRDGVEGLGDHARGSQGLQFLRVVGCGAQEHDRDTGGGLLALQRGAIMDFKTSYCKIRQRSKFFCVMEAIES